MTAEKLGMERAGRTGELGEIAGRHLWSHFSVPAALPVHRARRRLLHVG